MVDTPRSRASTPVFVRRAAVCAMKFCRLTCLAASIALASGCPGCPDRDAAPSDSRDAALDRPRDASSARARGRRRRRGVRAASNNGGAQRNAQGAQSPVDPIEDDTSEPEAARPRITETGPMLTENLGPAPEVNYDMGAAAEGPMGLSPEQVTRGMNPLMGRLGNCAAATTDDRGNGPHGRVSVRLRIHNDGRPIAARVSGGGGPPEFIPCVRRVVASARFDSFHGPDVLVGWGFDVD